MLYWLVQVMGVPNTTTMSFGLNEESVMITLSTGVGMVSSEGTDWLTFAQPTKPDNNKETASIVIKSLSLLRFFISPNSPSPNNPIP